MFVGKHQFFLRLKFDQLCQDQAQISAQLSAQDGGEGVENGLFLVTLGGKVAFLDGKQSDRKNSTKMIVKIFQTMDFICFMFQFSKTVFKTFQKFPTFD